MIWRKEHFEVDTDLGRIDFDVVNSFLATSYWADHRSPEQNELGWRNSWRVYGLYDMSEDGAMAGGCRIVGDGATFGWLADVFVLEQFRRRSLGKFLVGCVVQDPDIDRLGRMVLGTRDAHGLYAQFGWEPLATPDRWMQRVTEKNSCLQATKQ